MEKKTVKFVGPEYSSRERDDRHQVRNAVIVDIGNWTQCIPMCQCARSEAASAEYSLNWYIARCANRIVRC